MMPFSGVRLMVIVLAFAFVIVNSCGAPRQPDDFIDPDGGEAPGVPYPGFTGQDFNGEKNFATLLNKYQQGKPAQIPWAGFWWPYTGNGIASGMYGRGISPAGKYDAARGGRTHAQLWEVVNHGTGVPKVQGWWGHCNGWTAASALFPEPKEPVKVNGILFYVGDIKALLTETAMEVSADFFGDRVDWGADYSSPKYWDTVPDQYFLVLTNYIGKFRQPVLIDRFTGDQVWNHPLAGYRFEYPKPADYLGADPRAPEVYRMLVTSTIWWVRDDVLPDAVTPAFQFETSSYFESRTLKMEIWLDGPVVFNANGRIESSGDVIVTRQGDFHIGGAWRNGEGYYSDAHPDYMWVPYSVLKPTDYANKEVDIDWIRKHILSGGVDDPNVTPSPPGPAPTISPRPEHSSWPTPSPYPWPSHGPGPQPSVGPGPGPTPSSGPTNTPTSTPTGTPTVTPSRGPR